MTKRIQCLKLAALLILAARAVFALALSSDLPSPQPVGTTVRFQATPPDATLFYQFSVADSSGVFGVARDFSPTNSFAWTPLKEGAYQIRVLTIKVGSGTAPQGTRQAFSIVSRVTGANAVVSSTRNPLVALYSAPPCSAGSVHVEFFTGNGSNVQQTNTLPCTPGQSSNFYVAGMLASTTYTMRHVIVNGSQTVTSPSILFTTGPLTGSFPTFTVTTAPAGQTSQTEQVLLHSMMNPSNPNMGMPIATDLFGRLIWYFDGLVGQQGTFTYVTRTVPGGNMLLRSSQGNAAIVAEIDLAGNSVRQTNLAWIDAQLQAQGRELVTGLHHESIRFPNGQTLLFGVIVRNGAGGAPAILGDMVIALDANFQVVWTWNAFDHLSTARAPVLGETCGVAYNFLCGPSLANAIDWLHSNSISYTPDHNLIVSIRHQDWVIKIDYQDGQGTGAVLWKLGKGGDFTTQSSDPYPWFSHQHDARWIGSNQIVLYDNGNARCAMQTICDSRGQLWQLDEGNRTATLVFNGDLGVYSDRHGSAQALANGNYAFGSDFIQPSLTATSIELKPDSTTAYSLATNTTEYRTFRLPSLY